MLTKISRSVSIVSWHGPKEAENLQKMNCIPFCTFHVQIVCRDPWTLNRSMGKGAELVLYPAGNLSSYHTDMQLLIFVYHLLGFKSSSYLCPAKLKGSSMKPVKQDLFPGEGLRLRGCNWLSQGHTGDIIAMNLVSTKDLLPSNCGGAP